VPESAHFSKGEAGDLPLLRGLLRHHRITAVIHLAGSTAVPDSIAAPLAYYANNLVTSRNLIQACVDSGVKHVIFSSSATVYAASDGGLLSEDARVEPITPYGRSKLGTEWILENTARAHGFRHVTLRYFNVAGADPMGRAGPSARRRTHLIQRACQAALGRNGSLEIYGTDFPTRDGTGVRDYIHVSDLTQAHVAALDHLRQGGESRTLNCGYGRGFSVRDVIAVVSKVAGRAVPTREVARRAGDLAEVVADATRLKRELAWRPQRDDLEEIVATAYNWEKSLS
jgi:UDP-glucose 4-epimerase